MLAAEGHMLLSLQHGSPAGLSLRTTVQATIALIFEVMGGGLGFAKLAARL